MMTLYATTFGPHTLSLHPLIELQALMMMVYAVVSASTPRTCIRSKSCMH